MNALYTAASGLLAQHQILQATAGNIANQNSLGYLAQKTQVVGFLPQTVLAVGTQSTQAIGQVISAQAVISQYDVAPGAIRSTGVFSDLAISGNGFFAVRTPSGGVAYTQDGRFHQTSQGQLATANGDLVLLSSGKPVHLAPGPFTVSITGVLSQNNVTLGTLGLVDLPAAGLTSLGGGLYQSKTPQAFTGNVIQGAVNTSNGSLTGETVDLMQAEETYQSLTSLVNEESTRLKTAGALGVLG
ncbi:MAG: flagellar hook basal-body protein [Sulfobacillus thermotolerans]|nr:flagellar hook basal-body protein [Sulfobacillus thermotolerans]